MSVAIFRPMRPDANGLPEVGQAALKLGVRMCDVECDPNGHVLPNSGVSIATSILGVRDLPWFLLPFKQNRFPLEFDDTKSSIHLFAYRHPEYEPFQINAPIAPGLSVIEKRTPERGCIAPSQSMPLIQFDALLTSTQIRWQNVDWHSVIAQLSTMPDD